MAADPAAIAPAAAPAVLSAAPPAVAAAAAPALQAVLGDVSIYADSISFKTRVVR